MSWWEWLVVVTVVVLALILVVGFAQMTAYLAGVVFNLLLGCQRHSDDDAP
ncbi:hypothetical protein [Ottowia sp.]|uniref:hypothetical protein n=1 Tax=Ottowia sp. TaxID=1898956 RepID=UPI003A86BEE8